ncbi:MAG: nitroreductase family protein [Deltaproteobacteria bacterium]|jgi:hypothetical protein|nr:nitroreductase family protein [Deltaproteobacteria bacterium]
MRLTLILAFSLALSMSLSAAPRLLAADAIVLPQPTMTGGAPLMEALSKRKSHRGFQPQALSPQSLGDILWAAFGVNRDGGRRTIPTSHGNNELAVYAVLPSGVFLYDPLAHRLDLVLSGDRTMEYGGAPLTLLYAAPTNGPVGGFHAGSAYQNVGLLCASEGLANVVKTSGVDALRGELVPAEGWQVLVVQSIGLPAGDDF